MVSGEIFQWVLTSWKGLNKINLQVNEKWKVLRDKLTKDIIFITGKIYTVIIKIKRSTL